MRLTRSLFAMKMNNKILYYRNKINKEREGNSVLDAVLAIGVLAVAVLMMRGGNLF